MLIRKGQKGWDKGEGVWRWGGALGLSGWGKGLGQGGGARDWLGGHPVKYS